MEKLIRNPYLIVSIVIVVLATILYMMFHTKVSAVLPQTPLQEKVVIQDEMRIVVTPLTYKPKTPITFKVQLECYQHPEQTKLDLMATALFETNTGKPLLPTKWEVTRQEDYITIGIVSFPPTPVDYSRIKLSLFGLSEITFDWILK